jgi:ankyrin repeat protein
LLLLWLYFRTPLHEAASAGYEEVVTFLLERGADVNAQTEDGATVLSIAQTGAGSDHPVIELLTSWGASMTAPDPEL